MKRKRRKKGRKKGENGLQKERETADDDDDDDTNLHRIARPLHYNMNWEGKTVSLYSIITDVLKPHRCQTNISRSGFAPERARSFLVKSIHLHSSFDYLFAHRETESLAACSSAPRPALLPGPVPCQPKNRHGHGLSRYEQMNESMGEKCPSSFTLVIS